MRDAAREIDRRFGRTFCLHNQDDCDGPGDGSL